jgi:hypothetical protein
LRISSARARFLVSIIRAEQTAGQGAEIVTSESTAAAEPGSASARLRIQLTMRLARAFTASSYCSAVIATVSTDSILKARVVARRLIDGRMGDAGIGIG